MQAELHNTEQIWSSRRRQLLEYFHDGCQSEEHVGLLFFPDTTSRPQTTPHENDPNENRKHSCEGQIHFLEHLSH